MKLCFQPILALLLSLLIFACLRQSANANTSTRLATEQKNASEKYLLTLEKARVIEFFDDRKQPENAFQLWGKGWKPCPIGRKK